MGPTTEKETLIISAIAVASFVLLQTVFAIAAVNIEKNQTKTEEVCK